MRNCKLSLAALLLLAACTPKAAVDCTVEGAPNHPVIVKQLDFNVYDVLDTVKTDANCHMRYSLEVKEGQPEFVYLFSGDTKIASLLLSKGEKAVVKTDTLGHYEVEGSPESAKLAEVERSMGRFAATAAATDDARALTEAYIAYYRECTKYVLSNSRSLTVIPVLFQQLDANTPVFSQYNDAILFRRTLDTLQTVYPESRYVKALEKETQRRENAMKVQSLLGQAEEQSFPNLNMPDINGKKVSLAGLENKVVLLHFWDSSSTSDKMFNLDVLMPQWERWSGKGLQIYAVDVNPDKSAWASVVKAQKLPWINVNDGLGAASPSVMLYNVAEVPSSFLIADGVLGSAAIKGSGALSAELSRLLK